MVTLLDRNIFGAYLRSYAICFVSLLSLYIVLDLFTNLDDFARNDQGLFGMLTHIGTYYMYRSVQIFDRLNEAMVLLGAMFTVSWMQRSNEFLPLLSAGVSTHRILRPILFGSFLMIGVGVANQELLMPEITEALMSNRDDPVGEKQVEVRGAFDSTGVHLEGLVAFRKGMRVNYLYVTIPETNSNSMVHLSAIEATYIPPSDAPHTGGWMLSGTTPLELESWSRTDLLEMIDAGKYFLTTRDVDFETITRNKSWFTLASTPKLSAILQDSDSPRLPAIAVQFHMRLVRPVIGLTLVVFGLALILRDQTRNVFISAGQCLVMTGTFYGLIFVGKHLGETDLISPALAAWFPALLFGPLALSMYDGIHT